MEPHTLTGIIAIGICVMVLVIRAVNVNRMLPQQKVRALKRGTSEWREILYFIELGQFPILDDLAITPHHYHTILGAVLRANSVRSNSEFLRYFNWYSKYLLTRVKIAYEIEDN